MKVVEKNVIHGMLGDELARCEEMLAGIEHSLSELPKGVLRARSKRYKGKEYRYAYLKYREGSRVINKHIPEEAVDELARKLTLRKKYESEARSYRGRIAYLRRLLRSRAGSSVRDRKDK
jgi:hypothetical protein